MNLIRSNISIRKLVDFIGGAGCVVHIEDEKLGWVGPINVDLHKGGQLSVIGAVSEKSPMHEDNLIASELVGLLTGYIIGV